MALILLETIVYHIEKPSTNNKSPFYLYGLNRHILMFGLLFLICVES